MNAWKKKLNSERGASISFALMLFPVCAVVGSAVLVAGTAASGRMSKVAESDQRYYAVKSAARLVIDDIDGKSITIVKKKVGDESDKYYLENVFEDEIDPDEIDSIPFWTAYQLMQGNTLTAPVSFNLTAGDVEELAVSITETVLNNPYGEMTIGITKTTGTSPNEKSYSMILRFNLDKSEVIDESKDADEITTTITTDTFTWSLRDIQVAGSGVERGRSAG